MMHINFMGLYQEKLQDIQDFHDQYMALCKVCTELGLRFGRCEEDAKEILLKDNVTNPS